MFEVVPFQKYELPTMLCFESYFYKLHIENKFHHPPFVKLRVINQRLLMEEEQNGM